MKQKHFKSIIVIGFALFAMYFGAGNLIFPPYLGFISGGDWIKSSIGFTIADAGLGLIGIIALANFDGDIIKLGSRVNKKFAVILSLAIILCIGPFLAMPRTGATSYEIGILPIFGSGFSKYLFAIIFFGLVILLTIRANKVVDIVGKFLTPALIICVGILIFKGFTSPLGEIADTSLVEGVVKRGIRDGYQTMDALASCMFALVIINAVKDLKLGDKLGEFEITIASGTTAAICLAIVYGGLAHIGATLSMDKSIPVDIDNTKLLVDVTNGLLGKIGVYILGIIVLLACLTTAIGLVSATASYFTNLLNGRFSYGQVVVIASVVSGVISVLGVQEIIKISAPILEIIYPCCTTLIILGMFNKKIKDDLVYQIPVYTNLVLGLLAAILDRGYLKALEKPFKMLPLENHGLYWIMPMIVTIIIALAISKTREAKTAEN
ncbi:branched-chain amino acid transport system II carrier protein [Peptoniphilus raoultii]|uniref:branched-chain amino acid transport system II carrier protein n=1 Tax=Peptoniphilus raoultii TaxID=1776387 RepID=UPI0008D96AD4|nr:branched-chain amino acid transport system II carrier protein [Peptoniphilus raoultii]